ncbi:MAG: oligosaccharide flippase family protein [Sarcina sp.]
MDKKIIKNLIYNTSYQILVLLIPFITIPYISRVFTPDTLGIYSSTFANVNMFCILGMFAMNAYGTRVIAESRSDKKLLSIKFKELRYMQTLTVGIAFLSYIIIFLGFNKNNRLIYALQGINILAYMVDISWLYMGIEDFKKTVTRNIVVRLISIILIFIVVKDSSDIGKYILIISLSAFLGNLAMWRYKNQIVIKVKKYNLNIKKNIYEAFFLLIPIFCYQIYTIFDRSILGYVTSMSEVGTFDQSQKIIRIAVSVVTSLGIVMLPRVANMITNNNNRQELNELLKKSINLTLMISCASAFGIMAISKNFIPWFYGEGYSEVFILINMTGIVCIFTSLGSFFSNQYAIPSNNKKAYIIPILVGAIMSIIMNIFLGKWYGAIGAAVTIICVEFTALILRIIFLKKELDMKFLFGDFHKFIISGVIMLISINIISNFLNLTPSILTTTLEIMLGASIYIIVCFILNKELYIKVKGLLILKLKRIK